MKKILLMIIVSLGLVSCGINCESKPPKRAIMHQLGGMGMQYHFSIYIPGSGIQHSAKCPSYDYAKIDIYADNLGSLRGDEVIWNNSYGEVNFTDYGENPHNIQLILSAKQVVISNWTSSNNGTYEVEDTPPDSWGVPIY
jgi:hypothetical protein